MVTGDLSKSTKRRTLRGGNAIARLSGVGENLLPKMTEICLRRPEGDLKRKAERQVNLGQRHQLLVFRIRWALFHLSHFMAKSR